MKKNQYKCPPCKEDGDTRKAKEEGQITEMNRRLDVLEGQLQKLQGLQDLKAQKKKTEEMLSKVERLGHQGLEELAESLEPGPKPEEIPRGAKELLEARGVSGKEIEEAEEDVKKAGPPPKGLLKKASEMSHRDIAAIEESPGPTERDAGAKTLATARKYTHRGIEQLTSPPRAPGELRPEKPKRIIRQGKGV